MADYHDDLTVHSKPREIHFEHIRQFFEWCRIYGISLNPNNCLHAILEGKLPGHIVRKEGIYIDP